MWIDGYTAREAVALRQILMADDDLLDLGLATGTDKAQSVTLGLNWFANRHIRFQFNYDHTCFEDPITIQGERLKNEDTFTTRFLYDF